MKIDINWLESMTVGQMLQSKEKAQEAIEAGADPSIFTFDKYAKICMSVISGLPLSGEELKHAEWCRDTAPLTQNVSAYVKALKTNIVANDLHREIARIGHFLTNRGVWDSLDDVKSKLRKLSASMDMPPE